MNSNPFQPDGRNEFRLKQQRLIRHRDEKAAQYRLCSCISGFIFLIIGSAFIRVHPEGPFLIVSLIGFGLCILSPLPYIIWFLTRPKIQTDKYMQNKPNVNAATDELIINGIKIEPESEWNKQNKYLLDGFIRQHFIHLSTEYQQQYYPSELLRLIQKFSSFGFDVCPLEYMSIIQKDGIFIHGSPQYPMKRIGIGCSGGFRTGINVFKIKCIEPVAEDSIGVISNVNVCYDGVDLRSPAVTDCIYHAFYYGNDIGKLTYVGTSEYLRGIHRVYDNAVYLNQRVWKANTVITMVVDCNEWQLHVSITDADYDKSRGLGHVKKSMTLMADQTYYPILTVTCNQSKYLLLQKCTLRNDESGTVL